MGNAASLPAKILHFDFAKEAPIHIHTLNIWELEGLNHRLMIWQLAYLCAVAASSSRPAPGFQLISGYVHDRARAHSQQTGQMPPSDRTDAEHICDL